MTTLTKIIVTTLLSILFVSCQFRFGVKGNGNVTTTERTLNASFSAIEVSQGLDVYLSQANTESVSVQADENLQEIIVTEVENGVLNIYAKDNIGSAASKKIMVSFDDLESLSTSSGSDVVSTTVISAKSLYISSSSGSDVELDIEAEDVVCEASSGSDIKLSGSTRIIRAEASSGSDINAGDLKAETAQAEANSGADITVNTSKKLTASANSGGDIKYSGNPEIVEENGGPSGNIRKQ